MSAHRLPTVARAALVVLCASTSGCLADFNPASYLDNLRVITILAEPPEVAPGETAQVTVVTYDPESRPEDDHWYVCRKRSISGSGINDECLDDEDDAGLPNWLLPAGSAHSVPVTMPHVPTMRLDLPDLGLPPQLQRSLDVELPIDLEGPDTSGGYYLPIILRANVTGSSAADNDTRQAAYRLRYHVTVAGLPAGTPFSAPANHNPRFVGLFVVPTDVEQQDLVVDPVSGAGPQTACTRGDGGLSPDGGAASPDGGAAGADAGIPDGGAGGGGAGEIVIAASGCFAPVRIDVQAAQVVIPGGAQVGLRAVYAEGSEEQYLSLATGEQVTETLYTTWFATAGKFDADSSSPPAPDADAGQVLPDGARPVDVLYTPAKHLEQRHGDVPVELHVVGNDGRGGNAWIRARYTVRMP